MKTIVTVKDKLLKALRQKPVEEILAFQEQLSPISKKNRVKLYNKNTARQSAVLILIHNIKEVPHFTLIKRTVYKGVHSGQISLPGGKMDEKDTNLEETARRECLEEIGVSVPEKNIIGRLASIYVPPSNFLIHPFVGICFDELHFTRQEREVESIIHIPLDSLSEENIKTMKMNLVKEYESKVSYYHLKGHKVWGATATILAELHILLSGD